MTQHIWCLQQESPIVNRFLLPHQIRGSQFVWIHSNVAVLSDRKCYHRVFRAVGFQSFNLKQTVFVGDGLTKFVTQILKCQQNTFRVIQPFVRSFVCLIKYVQECVICNIVVIEVSHRFLRGGQHFAILPLILCLLNKSNDYCHLEIVLQSAYSSSQTLTASGICAFLGLSV